MDQDTAKIMLDKMTAQQVVLEQIAEAGDTFESIAESLTDLVESNRRIESLLDLIAVSSEGTRDGIDHLGWMAHNPLARLWASIKIAMQEGRK